MRRVEVVGVRLEMPSNQPVVLLREEGSDRFLPIWIGSVEGTAIAFAKDGVVPPRPLTHDLMADILTELSQPLREVHITELREGTFYAELLIGESTRISARPSDAIALALRCNAAVLVANEVLDEAAVQISDDSAIDEQTASIQADEELKRFREFLEEVSPEDFEQS